MDLAAGPEVLQTSEWLSGHLGQTNSEDMDLQQNYTTGTKSSDILGPFPDIDLQLE